MDNTQKKMASQFYLGRALAQILPESVRAAQAVEEEYCEGMAILCPVLKETPAQISRFLTEIPLSVTGLKNFVLCYGRKPTLEEANAFYLGGQQLVDKLKK